MEVGVEHVEQVAGELRCDFEGTCVAIAGDLASSDDPTHWLELLPVLVRDGAEERLETDFLPQVVQLVLGKSFDVRMVEAVNKFLQWTLARVAKRFQDGDTSRLSCLARVLDAHRRFYLYHGTSNDGTGLSQGPETENNENDESTEFQARRFTERVSSEYTSRYFMRNLEHWGQVGGFALFLDVLRADASFEMLQCILRIVYDVKDHLCAEFLAEYFPKLVDAVCAQIRNLQAAEFYALSRDSLLEVVQVMELLLLKIHHDIDIIDAVQRNGQASKNENVDERGSDFLLALELCEQRVQLLRLEISLRFFQSNSLEKRIYGLTEIVVIITRLYNDQIQEQPEPTAVSLYATLSFLVDWMHEKQLMQELLGEKMHVELIKRSTSLFQFASELECLPIEWIDLVWNCYHSDTESAGESRPVQRRHEAFRSTIHDLLMEMVTFVELPSLNHLVTRIESVRAKLDSNQLCLFAAIAARRFVPQELPESDNSTNGPRQRSLRQRILMHLWTVVLPANKSLDFCDETLVRMHEMLRLEAVGEDGGENDEEASSNPRGCELADELLSSCLDNISRRENLVISLKLFTQLSSLIAEVGIVLAAPHQHNNSYVTFMLAEIVLYKEEVRQALQATQWRHMDDDKRSELTVLRDHVNDVKNRLLALRASWILDKCGDTGEASFTEDQLDVVWHLMVVDAFLLDEAALCFQWIELCMNTPVQMKTSRPESENAGSSQALMPLRMAEYLVTTKFPTLSGECITLSALCCFHSIFRRINLVKGGLEIFSTASPVESDLVSSPTNKTTCGSSSDGDKDESVVLMTGLPLVGLGELWQLAVSATDSAVAEEIITLLASFHLAFAPNVQQTKVPFQCKMHFVEKCMEFIATAKADADMIRTRVASDRPQVPDKSLSAKVAANVAVVNRCIDLLRYFLEACKIGDDSVENDNELLVEKMESEGISLSISSDDSGEASKKPFRIEHLEERLPYLEIYPSPLKDMQSDSSNGGKLGYRAARRPSWTFRQQHALLDVIVDSNEEVDTEDTDPPQKDEEGESVLPRRSLDSPASRRSETECSPLRVELRADLLNKSGSPVKSNMRSPCVRANLRWPQAPSPQRGPDLRPEDIEEALTDYSERVQKLRMKDERLPFEDEQNESSKRKTRYGMMSQILANQGTHFDVLLELVDWDETTSQRTWDLLCCLPTNNELLRKMIRLRRADNDRDSSEVRVGGDVDWSDLLDGSSIQRLLYSLRLVEALLIPLETTGNGTGEFDSGRRQWRERFVRLGGAKHLYETLLKWQENHWSDLPGDGDCILSQYAQNLRATCLASVMRVLNYFFHWNRLSTSEKTLLSPFDARLHSSTLPGFVKTIELVSMLQVSVQLTERFCSRECHSKASFSEELAEAVYCGVQMCCSLILFSPHLTAIVFEPDQDIGNASCGSVVDSCSRITLCGWLKALLVDCSSKATRTQVLGVLSEMATAFGVMDCCSPARKLFDPFIVSACDLAAQDLSGSYSDTALEELFALCRVFLGTRGRVRTNKGTSSENSSDDNEVLAAVLVRKCIPDRLVNNLYRIVSQQQASIATKSIRPPQNQGVGILNGCLQLLTLFSSVSDKLRTAILRGGLCNSSYKVEASASSNSIEGMINFIHDKLLFGDTPSEHDTASPPVCRVISSRELAQTLLLSLVIPQTLEQESLRKSDIDYGPSSLNRDVSTLLNCLCDYQSRVLETVNLAGRQWNYAPADSFLDTTKSTHHAGLVNPGCICYMNSLVQQLFMMPGFCEGLLALDSSQILVDQSSSSWKDEVEQLQKLFTSLAYTNYRSCDPTAFALSHKDMDGNSTDVHLQMDADEFFSLLLDRLEMLIRPTKAAESSGDPESNDGKDFMARCFGGVLVNQILTQQGNLSEREEKFFALSVEVSKKRHLAESLELYVQGESLEGENAYFCEREQRKVSATKRVCIKTLPQTLVCHLKRFEFDYDTMEKMKINDFLEFPMELDMLPYTSEALATRNGSMSQCERAIMYDLVGVVVHSGTSDTGHYYSFVKDRHELENQSWLEFNDEVVRDFDVDTMGEECFGGEEVAQKWDSIQSAYSPIVQMKRRSAYMLIYERRSVNEESSTASCAAESISLSSQVQKLASQIMQENARYECVVNAFDPIYEQFIRDLIEGVTRLPEECDSTLNRRACELGCQFLFGIRPLRCRTPTYPTSSPASPSAKGSRHDKDSVQISLWLSGYGKNPSGKADEDRVQFSKWIFTDAVASPTAFLAHYPSTALHLVESQRTWLFDVLFLSPANPFLADSCFQVLLAAVRILAQNVAADNVDAEQSLTNFFGEVLNLFFSREPHLEVCDPASGCVLALSIDARERAMKQLGAFIEKCVCGPVNCEERMATEIRVIHRVFLENLQFLNRFLNTLQIPFEVSEIIASTANSPIPSRGIAPLAIETRAATPLREHDLRLCMFRLETKLLRNLLQSYDEPALMSVDSTLLLNHTALKNVVLFGLEDIVVPVLTRIVFESENPSSKCDRLVALLIGVLEEVKDTHAEKVLTVFGGLLDAEDVQIKSFEEARDLSSLRWTVHRHVFSPSRGLLESVVYYRDHRGSHKYTLLLLAFTVHRASRSPMLQDIFMNDSQFCSQVNWIPGWLVDHLDPNGAVRMQLSVRDSENGCLVSSETHELQEVEDLFSEVEKAFGVTIPTYCPDAAHDDQEEEQVLISPPSSPSVVASEDVILEAVDLVKENQHEPKKHGGRWLGKSEIGPEHEGTEVEAHKDPKPDWKLHRPREELSMLLRIDLDMSHNNAPEA